MARGGFPAWAALALAVACGSSGGGPAPGSGSGGGGSDGGPGDPPPAQPGPPGGGDWGQYRFSPRGQSENFATFTAAEAANTRELWRKLLAPGLFTQPIVLQDMVVFTTAFSGEVVSVEPGTGNPRWRQQLNSKISVVCPEGNRVDNQPGFWGSVAAVGNVLYAAAPDGNLYALDKTGGTKLWSVSIADPTPAAHGEFVQSSPAVSTALGKLYLGVASSEHCDLMAGRIVSVDLSTHAVVRRELLRPGQRGAGVWSSISIAEEEGRIYATSGNRVGPIGDEPLAQSIIALDARTLDVLDHWQDPTPLENSDFGSSPTLFEAGGMRLVAATNKDGWLYVLRRDQLSAGPVWKYQLAVIEPGKPGEGGNPSIGYGSISTPAFANGKLYAAGGRTPAGEPGAVVAFDPATGAVAWRHAGPGYAIAPLAAAGEILAVVLTTPDNAKSVLEILDQRTGAVIKSFPAENASVAAPSIGHGLVIWADYKGNTFALEAPAYRR